MASHSLVVECLLSMYDALDLIPSTGKKKQNVQYKPGMVAHTCNPNSWEMEVGGLGVHGHPWLYIWFEISLGYINPLSQKKLYYHMLK